MLLYPKGELSDKNRLPVVCKSRDVKMRSFPYEIKTYRFLLNCRHQMENAFGVI